jgi:hypothetical protein
MEGGVVNPSLHPLSSALLGSFWVWSLEELGDILDSHTPIKVNSPTESR